MIRVDALEKRHAGAEEATLRSVSFEVPAGRLVAILGSSGAGKSTLLRCLVGLELLDAGTVEIDGVVARARQGARACALLRGRVGLVPQSIDLFPHLTAKGNVMLAQQRVLKRSKAEAEPRSPWIAARTVLGIARAARTSGGLPWSALNLDQLRVFLSGDDKTARLDLSLVRDQCGRDDADRGNRDAGIAAVRDAVKAIQQGLNMTIYIEGKRSFDGRLLPFKKGPFYLAQECKIPVVPITISGTEEVMPKARFSIQPGTVTLHFHDPIEPENFGDRDALMAKVRALINSGLPEGLRE